MKGVRKISGAYIYSAENRADYIRKRGWGCTFEEVERAMRVQYNNLSIDQRKVYEDRASKINGDRK